jgi:hypothetical protein
MRSLPFVLVATILALAWLPAGAEAASGKVVVIVLENTQYNAIVGSPRAPYIASLIAQGELFTNYFAVNSGSLPNYLAMTSGLTKKTSPPSKNVFQAIDATGGSLTWKEFEESMTGNCGVGSAGSVPGTSAPLYTTGHDPAVKNKKNESCATNDVPMTAASFDPTALPDFTYIVPNQCDDMHTLPTGGQSCPAFFGSTAGSNRVAMGDAWLSAVVPQLLAQPDVTVIISWDEGNKNTGEHIATVEVGTGVTPGTSDATLYDHYSLEAGLYSAFGLGPAPNDGASATPLPIP